MGKSRSLKVARERGRKREFSSPGYAKHSFRSRLGVESHLDDKMRFGDKVVSSLSATFIRGGQTIGPCRFDDSCNIVSMVIKKGPLNALI